MILVDRTRSLAVRKRTTDHVQRDIDDHVFLPADHLATAEFDQDRAGVDAILGTCLFRMPQEAGIDPGKVLEDGMVTYLAREKGGEADLFTEESTQLEAYCSAIGKVLLAALPANELEAYLANGPFVALTRNTLTEAEALRREIEMVRVNRIAFDRCEIRDDLFCIGVPVRDRDGAVVAGTSASMIGEVPDQQRLSHIGRALARVAGTAI